MIEFVEERKSFWRRDYVPFLVRKEGAFISNGTV